VPHVEESSAAGNPDREFEEMELEGSDESDIV
jgi:hypothetical protein